MSFDKLELDNTVGALCEKIAAFAKAAPTNTPPLSLTPAEVEVIALAPRSFKKLMLNYSINQIAIIDNMQTSDIVFCLQEKEDLQFMWFTTSKGKALLLGLKEASKNTFPKAFDNIPWFYVQGDPGCSFWDNILSIKAIQDVFPLILESNLEKSEIEFREYIDFFVLNYKSSKNFDFSNKSTEAFFLQELVDIINTSNIKKAHFFFKYLRETPPDKDHNIVISPNKLWYFLFKKNDDINTSLFFTKLTQQNNIEIFNALIEYFTFLITSNGINTESSQWIQHIFAFYLAYAAKINNDTAIDIIFSQPVLCKQWLANKALFIRALNSTHAFNRNFLFYLISKALIDDEDLTFIKFPEDTLDLKACVERFYNGINCENALKSVVNILMACQHNMVLGLQLLTIFIENVSELDNDIDLSFVIATIISLRACIPHLKNRDPKLTEQLQFLARALCSINWDDFKNKTLFASNRELNEFLEKYFQDLIFINPYSPNKLPVLDDNDENIDLITQQNRTENLIDIELEWLRIKYAIKLKDYDIALNKITDFSLAFTEQGIIFLTEIAKDGSKYQRANANRQLANAYCNPKLFPSDFKLALQHYILAISDGCQESLTRLNGLFPDRKDVQALGLLAYQISVREDHDFILKKLNDYSRNTLSSILEFIELYATENIAQTPQLLLYLIRLYSDKDFSLYNTEKALNLWCRVLINSIEPKLLYPITQYLTSQQLFNLNNIETLLTNYLGYISLKLDQSNSKGLVANSYKQLLFTSLSLENVNQVAINIIKQINMSLENIKNAITVIIENLNEQLIIISTESENIRALDKNLINFKTFLTNEMALAKHFQLMLKLEQIDNKDNLVQFLQEIITSDIFSESKIIYKIIENFLNTLNAAYSPKTDTRLTM